MGFTGYLLGFTEFEWILPSLITFFFGFYLVLLGFVWVFMGFHWVLSSFIGFYLVLLGFKLV